MRLVSICRGITHYKSLGISLPYPSRSITKTENAFPESEVFSAFCCFLLTSMTVFGKTLCGGPEGSCSCILRGHQFLMSRLPRKMLRSPLKHPTGVFLNAAFNSPPSQIVKTWKSHRKGGFSMFWWTASVNSRTHYFSRLRADFLSIDLRNSFG